MILGPENRKIFVQSSCRFDEMLAGRTSWRLCSLAALLRDLLFHVVTRNGRVTAWVLSICCAGVFDILANIFKETGFSF